MSFKLMRISAVTLNSNWMVPENSLGTLTSNSEIFLVNTNWKAHQCKRQMGAVFGKQECYTGLSLPAQSP